MQEVFSHWRLMEITGEASRCIRSSVSLQVDIERIIDILMLWQRRLYYYHGCFLVDMYVSHTIRKKNREYNF